MNHSNLVRQLKKSDHDILSSLEPGACDLLHMTFALAGEVGELIDPIKKSIFYELPLDRSNVIEELGDIEFYLEGLRQRLRISREETIEANIIKLTKRYFSQSYTNTDAVERKDKPHHD